MHKKNKICLLYVIITSIIISISVYGLIEKKYNLEKVYRRIYRRYEYKKK